MAKFNSREADGYKSIIRETGRMIPIQSPGSYVLVAVSRVGPFNFLLLCLLLCVANYLKAI